MEQLKKAEKMLFIQNKLGYSFVLLYLVFNTAYTIKILNSMTPNRFISIEVMLNILLSLFVFLAAVKIKNYSVKWAYVIVGLGVFEFVRILLIPNNINGSNLLYLTVTLILAGVFALIGGYVTIQKTKLRNQVIEQNTKKLV
jgi:hypothetical protein